MPTVKVKLKNGLREIELEGEMDDLKPYLEDWLSLASANGAVDAKDELSSKETEKSHARSGKPSKKKRARSSKIDRGSASTAKPERNPNDIANAIKQSNDFDHVQKKIIVGESTSYQKVAFICWFVKEPMTSGDIARALTALNVKIGVPQVSNVLKRNIGNFITSTQRVSGGPPADYRLTEKAKSEFEKWLKADG